MVRRIRLLGNISRRIRLDFVSNIGFVLAQITVDAAMLTYCCRPVRVSAVPILSLAGFTPTQLS
jgi:hypothetical protein